MMTIVVFTSLLTFLVVTFHVVTFLVTVSHDDVDDAYPFQQTHMNEPQGTVH